MGLELRAQPNPILYQKSQEFTDKNVMFKKTCKKGPDGFGA